MIIKINKKKKTSKDKSRRDVLDEYNNNLESSYDKLHNANCSQDNSICDMEKEVI